MEIDDTLLESTRATHQSHGAMHTKMLKTIFKTGLDTPQFGTIKHELVRCSRLLNVGGPQQSSALPPYRHSFIPLTCTCTRAEDLAGVWEDNNEALK